MHQAQGVVRSGIGFHVPAREATIDRLASALAQVLPDLSPYRTKSQALRDEFAALGGVPRAADLFVQIAG
jgi:UDP:flavonoid glycosyltransferase YjiC (YdhE family)